MGDHSLPVVNHEIGESDPIREGPVVGVILAAGGSRRFGSANKLLADIDGESMVRQAVDPFLAADLDAVFVIVGNEDDQVANALVDQPIEIVPNPNWEEGQSTSLRAGVRAAMETDADAIVFGLGDMPWITAGTVESLIETYRRYDAPIIAAAYNGKRGNPVLFTRTVFDNLLAVRGDTGGRDLILSTSNAVAVETEDPGVIRDIDRQEDMPDE